MEHDQHRLNAPWICFQIGAREHYAIPRSLLLSGRDVTLVTDIWASGLTGRLLPRKLRQRFHPDLDGHVRSMTLQSLIYELSRQTQRRGQSWDVMIARNSWFQRMAVPLLSKLIAQYSGTPPIVFAYSYAALNILKCAKALGCRTVLGQIDPGPVEERIVDRVNKANGSDTFSPAPESYWNEWREECELSDVIVVNSDWSRRALSQEGVPDHKICTLELAYENQSRPLSHPRVLPSRFSDQRKLKVLFLGQLIPRKGIFELAEAIRNLESLPIEWHLVGGGHPATLEMLKGLRNTVVPGQVSRHEASGYYQNADVFILPTHSDGFALTQLEALSFGLPLITSQFCGQVVSEGKTGHLLSEVSAVEITKVVSQIVADPTILQRWQQGASKAPVRGLRELATDLAILHRELTGTEE